MWLKSPFLSKQGEVSSISAQLMLACRALVFMVPRKYFQDFGLSPMHLWENYNISKKGHKIYVTASQMVREPQKHLTFLLGYAYTENSPWNFHCLILAKRINFMFFSLSSEKRNDGEAIFSLKWLLIISSHTSKHTLPSNGKFVV